MKISNGYLINASPELISNYKIGPVNKQECLKNQKINSDNIANARSYLNSRFKNYSLTLNGRSALSSALSFLCLHKNDVITIFTTSANFYISGCVTKEIEKFCKWSRKVEENTKAIFVNHEFGFVYKKMEELLKYNLPIIEDCAHSFISQNENNTIGTFGDYVIYSLPKFFPIQIGGILSIKNNCKIKDTLDEDEEAYILSSIGRSVSRIDDIKKLRLENFYYLESKFKDLNLFPTFIPEVNEIPGVFMFDIDIENLDSLKIFTQSNGIESSIFYGKKSFFIPVHHNLSKFDLDYFYEVIKYFIDENK